MAILIDSETEPVEIFPGVFRKIIYLEHLMMVVIDFTNGPSLHPDEPHDHPHEQISYVASGELNVFIAGVKTHVKAGDSFSVPGGIPHCIQLLTAHVRLVDTFSPIREEFIKSQNIHL